MKVREVEEVTSDFETRVVLVAVRLGQILHQGLVMECLAVSNEQESLRNSSRWAEGYPYLTTPSMSAFDVFTSANERQDFFGGSWAVSAFEGIGGACTSHKPVVVGGSAKLSSPLGSVVEPVQAHHGIIC